MQRLLLLAAPLFAVALLAAPGTPLAPRQVEAASCSLVFNLFDADATNGATTNPGGSSTALAYPGFTNAALVGVDLHSTSGTACAGQSKAGGWYVMFSRWVGSLVGKNLDWSDATTDSSNNYAQVDQVPASLLTTTATDDYKNDVGTGTGSAPAATVDLAAAGSATLTSGSTITLYGDITTCAVAQGSTAGFAPGYARRTGGNLGVWYWLNNTVGNSNSVYLAADGGSETSGGGGKGGCSTLVATHSVDTINFDDTAPRISRFTTTSGATGVKTLTVDFDTTQLTESGSGAWLMAFSNAAGCASGSGSWSNWEAYATSKKSWNLAATAYGGSGSSAEGLYPACFRVIDKAGNIDIELTSFAYDKTAPTVTSFSTTVVSTYGISSYDYSLTFSEAVAGLSGTDFTNAGSATGCLFSPSATSGTTFTLTVTNCSLTGTLLPRLAAGAIKDAGENAGPAAAVSAAATLALGQKPPLVTLALAAASDTGSSSADRLTKAALLTYAVVFDEPVSGLAAADFTTAGTASSCLIGTPVGSGASYTLPLTGCSEGTLTLTLLAGAVVDSDRLSSVATSAETATIDRTAPLITILCTVEDAAALHPACSPGVKEPVSLSIAVGDSGAGIEPSALLLPAALALCERTEPVLPAGASVVVGALCRSEAVYAPSVTIVDRAGNSATKSYSVAIDLTAPQITISCALTRYGSYTACPTGSVKKSRFVKVIATDAGSGFAAKAFNVTSKKSCIRIKAGLTAGNKQWTIYSCTARRAYTFISSISDQAGNGPVNLSAGWRKL